MILSPVYIPSPVDKYAGLITLTLTVHGNDPCEPVSDAMELRIWTGTANAGPDQPGAAGTSTTLAGNTPTFGLGLWQIVSGTGGDITDPNDPASGFHGLIDHEYYLTWTISNIVCGTSVDTVWIRLTSCGLDITYEGQSYATVLIGDQCWMAESLNVGMMMPVEDMMSDNGVIEKYCYDDDQANCDIYGGLYTWYEAMQYVTTEGAQGICPPGWHLPTDAEVKILEGTVDSQYPVGDPVWDLLGWRGLDAGGNLKETGLSHWYPPNEGATNSSGFTALPAGWAANGDSNFLGQDGYFWTTSLQSDWVWIRFMWCAMAGVNRGSWSPDYGISARCMKDVE
jgi:uncharacterized protein (TIGR02145 family)